MRVQWHGADDRNKRVVKDVLAIISWMKVTVYLVVTFDHFLLFWALFPSLNICE